LHQLFLSERVKFAHADDPEIILPIEQQEKGSKIEDGNSDWTLERSRWPVTNWKFCFPLL
jgi:hypothetical protein